MMSICDNKKVAHTSFMYNPEVGSKSCRACKIFSMLASAAALLVALKGSKAVMTAIIPVSKVHAHHREVRADLLE